MYKNVVVKRMIVVEGLKFSFFSDKEWLGFLLTKGVY